MAKRRKSGEGEAKSKAARKGAKDEPDAEMPAGQKVLEFCGPVVGHFREWWMLWLHNDADEQ